MIFIKSYLRNKKKFIPFEEYENGINDSEYIEGAIELTINGVELINVDMWDYIDQLWAYIVNGLLEVSNGNDFKTYFPDQPIEMSFECLYGDIIKLTLMCNEETSVVVSKKSLINAIKEHLYQFFNVLSIKAPINADMYNELIDDLNSITS